jgi:prepilin-type N-terminal cleavage/methylation domain-containing protein
MNNKIRRTGMTLIELVAAVAVLAVVTTELLVLRSQAMEISADARNTRVAKELARQKMEEYLAYYGNLPEEGSGILMSLEQPDEGPSEFEKHPGFYWKIEQDTQDFDVLLPEEEEEEVDPEEEQEEDVPHNMVMVTLTIFRLEKSEADPLVLVVLKTLREETADEKAMSEY